MLRLGKFTFIAAGGIAALGAMLLIPGGTERVAIADSASIVEPSQETIAAIDAMLGVTETPAVAPQQVARVEAAPPLRTTPRLDSNLQTAALTAPEPEVPATSELPAADLEDAPLVEANLRPDAIGLSAVKLRAGPSSSTAAVTVLQPGQAVQTGESDGGWVEITLPDGTTGWVFSRYLASVAATATAEPKGAVEGDTRKATTAKATIKGKGKGALEGRTARIENSITARAKPNGDARGVFRTEPGERVRIVDVKGNWLHIQTVDGSSGWIQAG